MKPIIAVNLTGLFIKTAPWKNAHKLWFDRVIKETGNKALRKWVNRVDYFKGVDIAMKELMPKSTDKQRTRKAREIYMDSVLAYAIKNKDKVMNKKAIIFFKKLKSRYRLALVTTNTKSFVNKIIRTAGIKNLFDIVECSKPTEKDDKIAVFKRFIKKHGKPLLYVAGERKDTYDYCKKKNIKCVFANLERNKKLDVKTVNSLKELSKFIQQP